MQLGMSGIMEITSARRRQNALTVFRLRVKRLYLDRFESSSELLHGSLTSIFGLSLFWSEIGPSTQTHLLNTSSVVTKEITHHGIVTTILLTVIEYLKISTQSAKIDLSYVSPNFICLHESI